MMAKTLFLADLLDDRSLMLSAGFATFERGRFYYYGNRVTLKHVSSDRIEARVQDTDVYRVSLALKGDKLEYSCTCPVGMDGVFCKHLVATAMQARGQVPIPPEIAWQRNLERLIQRGSSEITESPRQVSARQYVIVFGLALKYTSSWGIIPFRVYVGKIAREELEAINWNDPDRWTPISRDCPTVKAKLCALSERFPIA
jgi:hypothetical protein